MTLVRVIVIMSNLSRGRFVKHHVRPGSQADSKSNVDESVRDAWATQKFPIFRERPQPRNRRSPRSQAAPASQR